MKYIELSPIRKGELYNYTLAWYLDGPVMRSKNEGIIRYKNFKNEITINKKNSTFYILEDNGEITKVEKFYLAENQTAIDSILKDEGLLLNL